MSNNTGPLVFPEPPQVPSIWFTLNFTPEKSSGHDTTYTRLYVISIVALILVIAIILLLHLYLRYVKCRQLPQYHNRQRVLIPLPSFNGVPRYELPGGLDPAEISSMSSFQYCNRPGNIEESNGLVKEDCVICLSFLEERDVVRMLATCRHMFHVECIDKWLAASASCPVCRTDVHPEEQSVSVDQVNDTESKEMKAELSVSSRLSLSYRRMLSRERSSSRVHGNGDEGVVGDLERGIEVNSSL
ncbi:hypothetical protein LUZ60_000615 [Juncus effusus]|nr:hypothetical protein LUZ60_000615 [Juncus effusus]